MQNNDQSGTPRICMEGVIAYMKSGVGGMPLQAIATASPKSSFVYIAVFYAMALLLLVTVIFVTECTLSWC